MTNWTAPRPWKGKTCTVSLFSPACAELWLGDERPILPDFTVFDPSGDPITLNGRLGLVHTDPRCTETAVGACSVHLMGEGVMAGLEERRDHLPGRFVVTKAIGLAVHLGASVINLRGMAHVSPRAQRNLDTMARPLKGRRVRLIIGAAP